MSTDQILTTAGALVARLRSFDGDDRERGLDAAEIIERTLSRLSVDPAAACARLRYHIGGKGMLDWRWSERHCAELEALSGEVFALLQERA